jgi:caffeoyl-CoA O-methyltransferase
VDPLVRELIDETRSTLASVANMQIAPDQAAFLTRITKIAGLRHAVEVGTFTGLSSLSIARGLAPGGKLICQTAEDEAIVSFNDDVLGDGRVDSVMLPIADGLTLARRK